MNMYSSEKCRLLFLIVFFFCSKLPAQEQNRYESEFSKNMAEKLKQKVLLSEEQTRQVEKILEEYIKGGNRNEQNSADKKVEALLDEKQKIKFEIIKDDWWKEINNAVDS